MKLLNKLRELRKESIQNAEPNTTGYAYEAMGLGAVTVHDIVRLHAEMDVFERLSQQRADH